MNAEQTPGHAPSSRRLRQEASAEVIEIVQTIRLLLHGGAASSLIRVLTGARMDLIQAQAEFEGITFMDRGGRRYRDLSVVMATVESHIAGSYFLASYQSFCKLYETMADWGSGVVAIDDADGTGTLVRGAFARALYATRQVCPTEKFTSLQARMIALAWGDAQVHLTKCTVCPTHYLQPLEPKAGTSLSAHGNCPVCRGVAATTKRQSAGRTISSAESKAAWGSRAAVI